MHSRDAIKQAARSIADDEGLEQLTLRTVAAKLGTGQASLYRYIADRRELLSLLVDDLASGYPIVDRPRLSPPRRVVAQFVAIRGYLLEHPWAAPIIADGPFITEQARPVGDHCLTLLRDCGLSAAAAMRTYRALWHVLMGQLLSRHTFGVLQGGSSDEPGAAWALEAVVRGALELERR